MKFESWLEKRDSFCKYKKIESVEIISGNSTNEYELTVAIPTYKRPKGVEKAINSVLEQIVDFSYQIIVVDNEYNLKSETKEIVSSKCNDNNNIFYYQNEDNIGMFGNWNRCFELAKGKYVVLLHDDDYLKCGYLQSVYDTFNKYNCGIIGVFSEFLSEEKNVKGNSFVKKMISCISGHKPLRIDIYDNYRSITITPTACAFNRSAVINVGGFDENYYPTSDIVLFNKITFYYGGMIIPDLLAVRMIGINEMKNVVSKCTENTSSYLRVLQKQLYNNRKKWIGEYGAAVNHGIFLVEKYNKDISVKKLLRDNNLSFIWNIIPKKILQLVLVIFWIEVLFKNKKRDSKYQF